MFLLTNMTNTLSGSQHRDLILREKKQMKLDELPLYDFEKLETATNSFHFGNMLGKGGFGPVYKVSFCLKELSLI